MFVHLAVGKRGWIQTMHSVSIATHINTVMHRLFSDLMKFSVENESFLETTGMFCSREKLIGLKVIQQNEKSTQAPVFCIFWSEK